MNDNTGSDSPDTRTFQKTNPLSPPPTPPPQWHLIPELLKQLPRWVLWSWVWNAPKGKWDKPPLTQRAAGHIVNASTTNRAHWMSYGVAKAAVEQGLAHGVGFVLTDEPIEVVTPRLVIHASAGVRIIGVDADECRDPITGNFTSGQAGVLLAQLQGTYCEVSPSLTGIKFLCLSSEPLPGRGKRDLAKNTEIYDRGRYFVVTGMAFEGYTDVIDSTAALQQLYTELGNEGDKAPGGREVSTAEPIPAYWEECESIDPFGLGWNTRGLDILDGGGTGNRSDDAYSLALQAVRRIGDYPDKILKFMMDQYPEAALARRREWDSAAAWMWHYTVVPALAEHRSKQHHPGRVELEVIEPPVGVQGQAAAQQVTPAPITRESVQAAILSRDPGDTVGVRRLIGMIAAGNFDTVVEVGLMNDLAGSCDLTKGDVKAAVNKQKKALKQGLREADASGSRRAEMAQQGLMPWDKFPDVKKADGHIEGVLSTADNVRALLDYYGIAVWRDAYTHKVDFSVSEGALKAFGLPKVTDIYTAVHSLLAKNQAGREHFDKYVTEIADKAERNRVLEYLEALPPSDGQDWIGRLAGTLELDEGHRGAESERAKVVALHRWLVQACAAADGCRRSSMEELVNGGIAPSFENMLVFLGDQGVGKTRWIRGLVPPELRDFVIDGVMLDPSDKDSVHKATRGWIAELGELDSTFRKADVARLKAYLSERSDTLRMPYERLTQTWPRRTVYAGTVNDPEFLSDLTGSRRYWLVPVMRAVQPLEAGIDLDQLWAQAWGLYLQGDRWWLDAAESDLIGALRQSYEPVQTDPVLQSLFETFGLLEDTTEVDWDTWWTATEIARACGIFRPTRNDLKKINNWLRTHWLVVGTARVWQFRSHQNFWRMPKILKNEN